MKMRNGTVCFILMIYLLGSSASLAEVIMTPDILPVANATTSPQSQQAVVGSPQSEPTALPTPAPWTYPIAKNILQDPADYLRLANGSHLLQKTDIPEDLKEVKVRKSKNIDIRLRDAAHSALLQMFEDAKTEKITLYLLSGYRSYQTQATMYANRIKSVGYDDKAVTQPGASDHQTGLGADIINKAWIGEKLNKKFGQTKEAQWMAENCARYGFIIRYPDGKQDITDVIYEPWHLRYVGIEVAQYIMENGLTLEEFTEEAEAVLAGEMPTQTENSLTDSWSTAVEINE